MYSVQFQWETNHCDANAKSWSTDMMQSAETLHCDDQLVLSRLSHSRRLWRHPANVRILRRLRRLEGEMKVRLSSSRQLKGSPRLRIVRPRPGQLHVNLPRGAGCCTFDNAEDSNAEGVISCTAGRGVGLGEEVS